MHNLQGKLDWQARSPSISKKKGNFGGQFVSTEVWDREQAEKQVLGDK